MFGMYCLSTALALAPAAVPATPPSYSFVITDFNALEGPNGVWTFEGHADVPEGTIIELGGLPSLEGVIAVVEPDGSFSIVVQLQPGEAGVAEAQAYDPITGDVSDPAYDVVRPTPMTDPIPLKPPSQAAEASTGRYYASLRKMQTLPTMQASCRRLQWRPDSPYAGESTRRWA